MRSPAAEIAARAVRDDGHRAFENDAHLAVLVRVRFVGRAGVVRPLGDEQIPRLRGRRSARRGRRRTRSRTITACQDRPTHADRSTRPALEPLLAAEQKALKEWAAVCRALEEGRQSVLLRKGGIIEETRDFALVERRFLLFPTYEHQDEDVACRTAVPDVVPRVDRATPAGRRRAHRARGPRSPICSSRHDLDAVLALVRSLRMERGLHPDADGLQAAQADERGRRPDVERSPAPVDIPVLEHFAGCKSWVPIDRDDRDGRRARPVGRRARARVRDIARCSTDEPSASRSEVVASRRPARARCRRRRNPGPRPAAGSRGATGPSCAEPRAGRCR